MKKLAKIRKNSGSLTTVKVFMVMDVITSNRLYFDLCLNGTDLQICSVFAINLFN